MTLRSGKLRHRINIETPVETQNTGTGEDAGEMTTEWQVLHESVPASIEFLSAREFVAAQSVQSKIVARVTIRYRDGLTPQMRIIHKGKIYNPEGWLPDLDSGLEYLTAPVAQGVNEG